ncbi:MAG: hypothetical protein ACFB16_24125 [Phormidesmis sp.]
MPRKEISNTPLLSDQLSMLTSDIDPIDGLLADLFADVGTGRRGLEIALKIVFGIGREAGEVGFDNNLALRFGTNCSQVIPWSKR